MAQKKIKIALSSTIDDPIANASIFFDGTLVFKDWVPNQCLNPLTFEHEFQSSGTHTIKIILNNDYMDDEKDLNLIVNYIALSDELFQYPAYTYLTFDSNIDLRVDDNSYIETATIWETEHYFEFEFDSENPLIWEDGYQYNLDHL
jgi:hypothetical protein